MATSWKTDRPIQAGRGVGREAPFRGKGQCTREREREEREREIMVALAAREKLSNSHKRQRRRRSGRRRRVSGKEGGGLGKVFGGFFLKGWPDTTQPNSEGGGCHHRHGCWILLPDQQRNLNKLPTELRCRNFVNKHRLIIQIGAKRATTGVCNVYVFRLSFHFACHHWWLGGIIQGQTSPAACPPIVRTAAATSFFNFFFSFRQQTYTSCLPKSPKQLHFSTNSLVRPT